MKNHQKTSYPLFPCGKHVDKLSQKDDLFPQLEMWKALLKQNKLITTKKHCKKTSLW
jgi:hypothetical protein